MPSLNPNAMFSQDVRGEMGLDLAGTGLALPNGQHMDTLDIASRNGKKLDWLSGGGEMAELIRSKDWSQTPLGPIESWPQSLRTTVSLCLSSNFPINIIWGPKAIQIYNAGYRVVCGQAHPRATGEPYYVTWESAWPVIGEPFERARRGETSYLENQRMFLHRNGYLEETFFTYSLSPIRDETGGVAGIFHPVTETTATMLSERRTRVLKEIADKASHTESVGDAARLIIETLSDYRRDLPFVMLYLRGRDGKLRLAGHTGVPQDLTAEAFKLEAFFETSAESSQPELIGGLEDFLGAIPCGEYPENTKKAFLLPLKIAGRDQLTGFVVAGLSTRLQEDQAYQNFFEMLGNSVNAAISNARAYEEERRRAEALAEIDRAKTTFFSNVSHEFRTPLTLILGPLESLLSGDQALLPEAFRQETELIYRNALRLLKLVNTLLDFSRIEADRAQAEFQKTDLGLLTADLASTFRSTIEKAGMKLTVNTRACKKQVYVDREMWEKIVLNLLSNAFKYTFEGEIRVELLEAEDHVELAVSDTGTGVSEHELPKLFERFHRVQGARGRTHEGTGIGLALVQELVRSHCGVISAESTLGQGSTFRIKIPFGSEHLPQDRLHQSGAAQKSDSSRAFVEEALRWLPSQQKPESMASLPLAARKSRILLADDNADMRAYVTSLLAPQFEVEAVANGAEALAAARRQTPDLVVSDVMMPEMDGFGLVQAIRADVDLKLIPVILLSARAGNEAKLEGLEQGVDDYLIKPFSAGELLARIQTQLRLYQAREQVIRQSEGLRLRDEFIQVASHELKTPVASLQLQLQLLRRQLEKRHGQKLIADEFIPDLDGSLKQISILTRLINDLLEVSRLQSGQISFDFTQTDLSQLIREVMERYAELLKQARCHVSLQVEDGITGFYDRSRIEQILVNLISNVCKYAPGSAAEVSLMRSGDEAYLTVKDSGPGIPQDQLKTIFERFSRAVSAKNVSGLGLGLFIAKRIVEAHQGSIHVKSSAKGTVFTIRLPIPSNPECHEGRFRYVQ